MNFSIATNWDDDLHRFLAELNAKHETDKVAFLFGSAPFSIFGNAVAGTPLLEPAEIGGRLQKFTSTA